MREPVSQAIIDSLSEQLLHALPGLSANSFKMEFSRGFGLIGRMQSWDLALICTASSADRNEPIQMRFDRESRRCGSRISDTHFPHRRMRTPRYREPFPDMIPPERIETLPTGTV